MTRGCQSRFRGCAPSAHIRTSWFKTPLFTNQSPTSHNLNHPIPRPYRSALEAIDPLSSTATANLLPFYVIGNEAGWFPELRWLLGMQPNNHCAPSQFAATPHHAPLLDRSGLAAIDLLSSQLLPTCCRLCIGSAACGQPGQWSPELQLHVCSAKPSPSHPPARPNI